MKIIGWIMVIIVGLIIFYNVSQSHENAKQIEEHPWTTILSGGENIKPAYTFMPPYSAFELTVMAGGVIGVVLIICGVARKKDGS
jgi:hypothetical protein